MASSTSYTSYLGHLFWFSSSHLLTIFFYPANTSRRYSDLLRQVGFGFGIRISYNDPLFRLSKRTSFVFKDSNIPSILHFSEQNPSSSGSLPEPRAVSFLEMPFCSLIPRRRFLRPPRQNLMDLSSLEGPPIDDPRVVITPDPRDDLVHLRSPTIDSNTNPSRLWRSLPPRPSSRGPSSSYESPTASNNNNNNNDNNNNNNNDHLHRYYRPSNPRTETSLSEGQLRRAHAQRGRRTPSPEIGMDIDLHMELHIDQEQVPRLNQRTRSPRGLIPLPLLSTDVPASSYRQGERSRRTQSCYPLVWVESEQQWEVSESYLRQQQQQRQEEPHVEQIRTPDSIFHRMPLSDPFLGLSLGTGFDAWDGAETESVDCPPTYESHGFSPTYVRRLGQGQGRWSEVAYRMHDASSPYGRR